MATRQSSARRCIFAAGVGLLAAAADAQTVATCRHEADNVRRLACYDRLFGEPDHAAGSETRPPDVGGAPAGSGLLPPDAASPLSVFWELEPGDKRGPFIVRTYQPNFLLPVHYTSNINRHPFSPSHPVTDGQNHYRRQEAKLQISLRAKVAEGILLPNADLWFAYTQRSLWQVWNRRDSAPFRSTDYQPEAIYVVPVPRSLGTLPADWRLRMVQLGLAHQSNGQSDPLSRSWNYVYAGAAFERDNFLLQVRGNHRLQEGSGDDNPDLTRYIGDTEITASWLPGPSTASVTWRSNRKSLSRGSLQMDWTYPVSSQQPTGLHWYVQLFTGYGETLLDYNRRQASIGLGLTLFQF